MAGLCLPPSLLYFVIYNPEIRQTDSDDEDADEQAQVLFYTAKDHAVSRDRVLRQVGLAKALVNFSSMFGAHNLCESVHSQTRRMIMLEPEPDYWIHACIDLSKTSRPPPKDSNRTKAKGKQRETIYDFHEASLHDATLRAQLQCAYESFKATHGSFSSILAHQGKEALELQLERFFTVWAWSWNLEKPPPFSDCIGVRIHPLSNQLLPLIDASLEDTLPPLFSALVLSPEHVITTKDRAPQYPPFLARHLLTFLALSSAQPSPKPPVNDLASITHYQEKYSESANNFEAGNSDKKPYPELGRKQQSASKGGGTTGRRFLGVPPLNMNMNATMSAMDVRKWGWPDYLTFGAAGKGEQLSEAGAAKSSVDAATSDSDEKVTDIPPATSMMPEEDGPSLPSTSSHSRSASVADVSVDSQALQDALSTHSSRADSSDVAAQHTNLGAIVIPDHKQQVVTTDTSASLSDTTSQSEQLFGGEQAPESTIIGERTYEGEARIQTPLAQQLTSPLPSFRDSYFHIPIDRSSETRRCTIRYLRHEDLLLALVPVVRSSDGEEEPSLDEETAQLLALHSRDLLIRIHSTIIEEEEKISTAFQPSTVQNVLQKSQYVVSASQDTVYTSHQSTSTSWHLHEARDHLSRDHNVLEVYSRRQNPQDWHVAKRVQVDNNSQDNVVYMEIGRKEASLPDVDNEIASVIRRCLPIVCSGG